VVQARPVRAWERGWKWARRYPVVATLVTAVALSLLLGIVVSALFALQLARRNQQLDQARRQADDRFVQALDAYRQMVIDMQAKLQNRSGTQDLRKALLADALDGLEKRDSEEFRAFVAELK
jgi:hypothetical protein